MLKNFIRSLEIKSSITRCKMDCELGLIEANSAIAAIVKGITLLPEKQRRAETESLIDFSKLIYEDRYEKAADSRYRVRHMDVTASLLKAIASLPVDERTATTHKLTQMIEQSQGATRQSEIDHVDHIHQVLTKSYQSLPESSHTALTNSLKAIYQKDNADRKTLLNYICADDFKNIPESHLTTLHQEILAANERDHASGLIPAKRVVLNAQRLMNKEQPSKLIAHALINFSEKAFENGNLSFGETDDCMNNAIMKLPENSQAESQIRRIEFWAAQAKNNKITAGMAVSLANQIINRLPAADQMMQKKNIILLGLEQFGKPRSNSLLLSNGDDLLLRDSVARIGQLPQEEHRALALQAIETCHGLIEKLAGQGNTSSHDFSYALHMISAALAYLPAEERAQKAQYSSALVTISEPINKKNALCMVFKDVTDKSQPRVLISDRYSGSTGFSQYSCKVDETLVNIAKKIPQPEDEQRQKLETFLKPFAAPRIA